MPDHDVVGEGFKWTPPICRKCGGQHYHMADVMTCLYAGQPLKDGGVWTHETSIAVCNRIADKLEKPDA